MGYIQLDHKNILLLDKCVCINFNSTSVIFHLYKCLLINKFINDRLNKNMTDELFVILGLALCLSYITYVVLCLCMYCDSISYVCVYEKLCKCCILLSTVILYSCEYDELSVSVDCSVIIMSSG